ncbi:6858_t:CDS:2 [Entrophospora sp. SA101]|nr:6858_t:CDS:2 [Entrophospora sp. SA101]
MEELERLENASEGEKAELRLEISSLKRSLYQTKKEIRDKVSYTDIIEKQLQESEERVQNLRHRFKVISSRRSSPNLYNSEEEDIDMAHIDPFINITRGLNRLENHFTGGTPLNNPANIIQGMYGTLNTIRANYQRIDQDLDDVTNQRDARDAQIVQLQQDVNYFRQQNIALQNHVNQLTLERNNSQNDLALMTTAYYNEREERRHWWRVAKQLEKGMQMRINTLLLDKLALNFKLRRCQRHGRELQQELQQYRADKGLLEYNRMAGYELPKFRGRAGEDPEVFLTEFQRWCETANYDPGVGHRMRMRIHGIFETCLLDDAKDWYETNVKGKNWELVNISDNCGHANLNALNGLTNNQIRAINANQFRGGSLQIRNTAPANGNQPAIPLVPPHTVWHEDWLTSGGRPTDLAPNASNANVGGNVIAPGNTIGQVIDYFRHAYPTVTAEKSQLVFTTLAQGSDPVGRFYANLKKMVKLAYPTLPALNQETMIRQQFFQGLSPDNKIEVRRIGLEHPISALLPKLEEIERQKAEMMLGQYNPESHPIISRSQSKANTKDSYITGNTGMTKEIENLVKSIMASSQSQPVSSQTVPQLQDRQLIRPSQMEPGKIYRDPNLRLNDQEWLRMNEATDRLSALADQSTLQSLIDTITKGVVDKFSSFLPKKNERNMSKNAEVDSDEDLADRMSKLSINKAIAKGIEAGINSVNKSSKHHCSNCNRTGHNSCKCTRKKRSKSRSKKRGSVNKVAVDSGSDTNFSDNDSSDNNSDSGDSSSEVESDHSFDTKQKNTPASGKSGNKSTVIDKSLQRVILDMLDGIAPIDWIEKLKAKIENPSDILPSIKKSNFTDYREPVPAIPDSEEEETLDDPMEIDFVIKKEPTTTIATIPCKIKRLKIPAMTLDSAAQPAIVTDDIVKRVGGKIDKSEIYDLSGIATVPTESIGVIRNLPITFPPGFTIYEDFVVVKYKKPTLIFSNPLLKKYKCAIDWAKDELKIPFNGKDHIIPVTMHNVKNNLEVNCATASQNDKSLVSNQISQETDSDKDDNITLEEWHAPARFSSDSDDPSLKKTRD